MTMSGNLSIPRATDPKHTISKEQVIDDLLSDLQKTFRGCD